MNGFAVFKTVQARDAFLAKLDTACPDAKRKFRQTASESRCIVTNLDTSEMESVLLLIQEHGQWIDDISFEMMVR